MRASHRAAGIVVGLVAALALPASSEAAFPGANGKIAFATWRDANQNGNIEIYAMNADGSGQTRLTSNVASDQFPSWSPDGTKIAFESTRDGNSEIYTMNADGTNQTRLTNNPAIDDDPAWSPDGTKIAFESTRDGNAEIYTMNADGTNQTRLTNNPADDFQPAWSPDGTKIAFNRTGDAVHGEIYTMNADGTGQTNLTNNTADDGEPAWSPDGTKIAFTTDLNEPNPDTCFACNYDVYTMNADGTNQTRLTNNTAGDTEPAWSPDGTKIAFTSSRDGAAEIYTMNADGTNQTNRTNNPDSEFLPDWQPIPYTGYARPRGASPYLTYLVPAYKQCVVGNNAHGPPLSFPSCSPPQQASMFLTVGTSDSNGQANKSIGSVKYVAKADNPATPADEADVAVQISITDVRNKSDLSDYTGELQVASVVRITDHDSGPSGTEAATMQDLSSIPVNLGCTATADTSIGSSCLLQTSVNAIIGNAIVGGKRAVWQLGQVQVYDGGADGQIATNDNTLFMDQGVFVP